MKKLITAILLCSVCVLSFAAPKKGKSNNIKLDPKNKFAIEGVEFGNAQPWYEAELTAKGEILWNQNHEGDYAEAGWDLRGTDLSKYGGIKIELSALSKEQNFYVKLRNPASAGEWGFNIPTDSVVTVFFNGIGKSYGDMKNPDPKEGFEIVFGGDVKPAKKTVIKNIELIMKEDMPDVSHLELLGVDFGTSCWRTRIIGNEITWPKGYNDGNAGWNLEGIDLSEYDRIRIELESNDRTGLEISMDEKDGKNYHAFSNSQIQPGIYEADLSGEGYTWRNDDGTDFNKSEGLNIFLHYYNEKPSSKECHTVIKSVQLLKGKRVINENLMIEGNSLGGAGWSSKVYDGGVIEWEWNGKEKYPCAGWKVKGVDFSKWKVLQLELSPEAVTKKITLTLYQRETDASVIYNANSKTVIKAKFDGSDCDNKWENKGKWDPSLGIDEIWIRYDNLSKSGEKTIVKSVKLLAEDDSVPQPERLILNGAKFGSKKDRCWLDDDFVINWKNEKAAYYQCGWKLEKLDGDILEIKVTSTDVPLRLRIREYANKNESSWLDDGTHIFRINLKNKKQINAKGGEKASEWNKMSKPFDFSQGCEIVLEPVNGVFKDGKKTVVEYIKVE